MHKTRALLIICAIFALIGCVYPVYAAENGLETTEILEEEKLATVKKINLESIQDDSYRGGIACFDVNQSGVYALAFDLGPSSSIIHVYDSSNMFLYGFEFVSDGAYGIEFYEDDLAIYFIRGNKIAVYDQNGECKDVLKAVTTPGERTYYDEILNRTRKEVAGKMYTLERDADIGDSYSRFVVENEFGERTVLYDYSGEHRAEQVLLIAIPIGLITFVIWGVYQQQKEAEEQDD